MHWLYCCHPLHGIGCFILVASASLVASVLRGLMGVLIFCVVSCAALACWRFSKISLGCDLVPGAQLVCASKLMILGVPCHPWYPQFQGRTSVMIGGTWQSLLISWAHPWPRWPWPHTETSPKSSWPISKIAFDRFGYRFDRSAMSMAWWTALVAGGSLPMI